jgi:MtrB/PioB family decaheme-associated outer membrane protein
MTINAKRTGAGMERLAARWALAAAMIVAGAGQAAAQGASQAAAPGGSPAAAPSASDLTRPASTAEVGGGGVTDGSFKAGEYNGLQKKGVFFIGDLDIRGGGAYDSGDATRYRIRGTDLGLDTRTFSAEYGMQGTFRLSFGFDQLRANRSDSYQTPYLGAGSNVLTLPSTWLVPTVAGSSSSNSNVNSASARGLVPSIALAPYIDTKTGSPTIGTLISPNATQAGLVNAAVAADLPLFRGFGVETTRKRFDAAFSLNVGSQWTIDAAFTPERKSGTKLMGTVSRSTGGDISTVIPDKIDSDTEQVNLNATYRTGKGVFQGGYYGSFFTNNVPFMSWQNWATSAFTTNTMSSAPSNSFNQINGSAAYALTRTTRLTASGAYGRNTQDDKFLTDATTVVVPVSSLNGLVVSSAFNVKLTSRPSKKLNLTAAYKFDDRDNRTAVNIFQYADAGDTPGVNASFAAGAANPLGAVLAQNANANRPYSKTANQFSAEADYALAPGQRIIGGYQFQRTSRDCPGSWIACADAGTTNEQTVRAEWRATAGSAWTARIAYEYSQRRSPDYNENAFLALVPYANVAPAGQTTSALQALTSLGLTGYGPVLGYNGGVFVNNVFFPSNNALPNALYANNNRISELIGMRRYYLSDRNRNKIRTLVTWMATDAFTLQAGLDYSKDSYPGATYGLQRSNTWAANVDGSYALGEKLSVDAYYTFEGLGNGTAGNSYTANSNTASVNGFTALAGNACDGYTTLQQRNNNNKLDPCLNWFADMADRVHTFGVGVKGRVQKLDVTANVMTSRASSTNNVSGGNWANNPLALAGAPAGTTAAFFIPAAAMPPVTAHVSEVRLNAIYPVAKGQSIRLLYSYLRTNSADWLYEGTQMGLGTPSGVLPTNEQAFNFAVHVFAVSYIVRF